MLAVATLRLSRLWYLVTVSPEIVLGTDVLIPVLGLVLAGSVVCNVLPVSIPSQCGVDAGDNEAMDGDTMIRSALPSPAVRCVPLEHSVASSDAIDVSSRSRLHSLWHPGETH